MLGRSLCIGPDMKKIPSPVAGTVFRIQSAVGARVGADDEIMLIESMKMEIPVLAEASGTIAEILVAEGDPVKEGQPLMLLA